MTTYTNETKTAVETKTVSKPSMGFVICADGLVVSYETYMQDIRAYAGRD